MNDTDLEWDMNALNVIKTNSQVLHCTEEFFVMREA